MPTGTIILLGAFAGLTIYLGLPVARLKRLSPNVRIFLSMVATGVLVFLLYDVLGKASEPIVAALTQMRENHTGGGAFVGDLALLVLGLGVGSVGLVYFNQNVTARFKIFQALHAGGGEDLAPPPLALASVSAAGAAAKPETKPVAATGAVGAPAAGELTPQGLALIIAAGIGLHNFSEGLAIGQSAASGALQLAVVLIIGFGLHNMTEGFGIAGPLTGREVSWKFLALLGLIGGGPTFLGTVTGIIFHSPQLFILFLALAAGAIIYVIAELLGAARRVKVHDVVMWGILIGFLLGYATDLIVTFAGA
jgi:ZIP family zinc transporter